MDKQLQIFQSVIANGLMLVVQGQLFYGPWLEEMNDNIDSALCGLNRLTNRTVHVWNAQNPLYQHLLANKGDIW